MDRVKKCALIVLDGLGDRAYERFDGKTPLAAARTPNLDRLAALGANGLYHAGRPGVPLPSENAHLTMFGYHRAEFPGRGPLEAIGADIALGPDDVAVLAHFCSVQNRDGRLYLHRDKPEPPEPGEMAELFAAVESFRFEEVTIRLRRTKGLFGVLVLSGPADPRITDTNPMVDGRALSELLPHKDAPPAAAGTAQALKAYLVNAHRVLENHKINFERRRRGLTPVNAVVTQRAGRLGRVQPFSQRFGMRGLSISSGVIYHGLCAYLGMDVEKAPETDDPGRDLARRLESAREALAEYDYVHVHTKAPDEAAHAKDPDLKKRVVETLDAGMGEALQPLLDDPEVIVAVTADHSTPSFGPLIHSGEPVPLCVHGRGLRRDAVTTFDEVAAATGSLGFLRGRELMFTLLNAMDRAALAGIRDSPEKRHFWPGDYEPFSLG